MTRGLSSAGRAPALQAGGHRFEPCRPHSRKRSNASFFLCIENIGDGIRPSERRKGYATEMLRLALIECKKIGLQRVLMVCSTDNIGSAKSIINNGGVLENEITNAD